MTIILQRRGPARCIRQAAPRTAMVQVRDRFIDSRDGKAQCRRTRSQSANLRKDKPHPVRLFPPGRKLRARVIIDGCWASTKRSRSKADRRIAYSASTRVLVQAECCARRNVQKPSLSHRQIKSLRQQLIRPHPRRMVMDNRHHHDLVDVRTPPPSPTASAARSPGFPPHTAATRRPPGNHCAKIASGIVASSAIASSGAATGAVFPCRIRRKSSRALLASRSASASVSAQITPIASIACGYSPNPAGRKLSR